MALDLPDLNAQPDPNYAPLQTAQVPTATQNEAPLQVGESIPTPNSSPETITNRASKFKYGLGDLLQKTQDEIFQNLTDGREDELRASAASTIDERKRQATEALITKVTANKQGPLTQEERDGLVEIVSNMSKTTDPNTVLETAYGRQFIASLDRFAEANPDNVLNDAKKIAPEAVAKMQEDHSTLVAKQQVINTLLENARDAAKSQGWLGWGYDKLKMMIPGYEDVQLRGNVPDVGIFAGGGLGENLEQQRKTLLRLPTDEMASRLKKIVEPWMTANPDVAIEFLEAMHGLSQDDITVKNWSLPTGLVGLGVGGKAAKGVQKALTGVAEELPKEAVVVRTSLMKGMSREDVQALRDTAKGIEDMSKAAGRPDASKSTIEAASGDLQESAVTRTTTNAVADANNVPMAEKRAVEALVSTQRADREKIAADPGKYGQDIVNRIDERGLSIENQLIDTAQNIQKNDRLPEVLSNESAVRLIIEDMKNKYRDLKNSVIDTSAIYREPISNTFLIDFHIGKPDGTYFPNRDVAQNFIDFHKLGGADIVEGTSTKFTKPVVEDAKYTKNIADTQALIERNRKITDDPAATDAAKAKAYEQISIAEEYIVDQAIARRGIKQTATVEQQGLGYYVKITKPIDETRPVIRQAIAQTGNTKIPESPVMFFLNNWIGKAAGSAIGKYRTPEEVLSLAERQNRLTTTYAPSSYFKIMVENSKEINKLKAGRFSKGRKRWEEWQQGLENAQELPDQFDPDRKGYFFQSPGEMEGYWQQWFNRLPDEQEIAAYFEFKRGMEIDRVFRNIAEHRNQQRVGSETHNIISSDAAGNSYKSADFNGVIRDKLPGASDNIAVIGNKLGEEKLFALDKQSTTWKKDIQKDIDRGFYKLVELYNPEQRPLNGFGNLTDERVRYVLVPQLETRPLDWNHIPRRGGGHIDYDYDFYIKQAKVKFDEIGNRHWYEGDTTIMAAPTHVIGKRVAEHLNEVRRLLKDQKDDEAKAYSNKHMHVSWDEVRSWFKGAKDAEGKYQPPRLNINEDIQVIRKGTSIIKEDNSLMRKYADFRDATTEGSLARNNQVEFGQERDAFELLGVNVEGTKANPLYKVAPANKVDVVTTMNRGFARIARSNFMDDYKTMAVEHWLAQAANYLDVKDQSQIWHSPYYYFNEGKFLSSAPAEVKLRLDASRYHTQQLTGQPSTTDALLHSMAQKMADSAFEAFGPKGLVVTPTWLLPKLKDPFGTLRSIAFDVKLGLFNVPQFIVQAGNYSNIMGIAGYKYAAPGTIAAQFHFWSRVNSNPAFLKHLDNMASKFNMPGSSNWKPGEFTEAFNEGMKTGFWNTGGEYAALDTAMNSKVITTKLGTFLDWGRQPFKLGEENARLGAWYTAFKEYRDKNPTGRITNEARAAILQRADLLNVNMSRASSSAIHKGIWSVTTQFYTYQIRLTELVFGNRLTGAERGRLMATNALLYGIPMSVGVTSIPAADYIRQKAMEGGLGMEPYVVGDDFIQSALMEGLPSAIGAIATGNGDPKKGTWYDVGPRFGTKGLEFLGSASSSQSNKGWLDALGGPVYSIIKDTIAASDGMRRAFISMARRDGDVFPVTAEDLADVFREITSFNAAWRVYAATQYGRWVSKKDAYLADSSTAQTIFSGAFGVKDVAINDIQIKNNSLKSQAEYEKKVEDQFRQEFRRGMLAQNDNPELAKKFFTRATAWLEIGGYREDRINSLVSKALDENESIMEKTNWDFYIRKSPDATRESLGNAYRKTKQIEDMKRGE